MHTLKTAPSADRYRATATRGLPLAARVDRKSRTIFGAKAMQLGPLNPGDNRPWEVDATTLSQLASLVNSKANGVKMRFAHPNLSRDGMGRLVGRALNARVVNDCVLIDCRLHEFASRGPQGNLADHILDVAESAPEDFGLSAAPLLDREAMKRLEPRGGGATPIRLKGLHAIDFVDEPAATKGGLFSLESDSLADLPATLAIMLDDFFGDAADDVVRARCNEFLDRYLQTRGSTVEASVTKVIQSAAEQNFAAEWREHQALFESMGVSLEDYCRSRQFDTTGVPWPGSK